jgi:hypothetical protein
MMLPLMVQVQPATFDAGSVLRFVLTAPSGPGVSGGLMPVASGLYGGMTVPVPVEGTWVATVTAGGMDASVQFTVDRTAPVALLQVTPPPVRVVDGGLSEVDPAPEYADAYRRDEMAEVRVVANEPVIASAANISGLPAGQLMPHACSSCPVGQCTCFAVDASQLTIPSPGFRGEFPLMLSGVRDIAGNTATSTSATLHVTRWKWKKLVGSGGAAVQSPALDLQGNVFTGGALGTNGAVVGLAANGAERFPANSSYGAITTAPVIGRWLYVAAKDGSEARIRQIDGMSGMTLNSTCLDATRVYDGPMAIVDLAGADDRIVAVAHNGTVVAARPTAAIGKCFETGVSGAPANRHYTVVANDLRAFMGNNFNATLTRVEWNAAGPSWGDAGTNTPTLFTEGLALFGTTLAGGGGGGLTTGGVFAMKADGADFTMPFPVTFTRTGGSSEASGPIVTGTVAAPSLIYGNGPEIVRIQYVPGDPGTFMTSSVTTAAMPTPDSISTAPVAGAGGIIYFADSAGTVSAYSSDLQTLQWRLSSNSGGVPAGLDSALNIDVARTSTGAKDCTKPGTLYVPSTGDGSLYAFIVDSKGIDAAAPWPKFQHDPRNTGNPAASLADFSCP